MDENLEIDTISHKTSYRWILKNTEGARFYIKTLRIALKCGTRIGSSAAGTLAKVRAIENINHLPSAFDILRDLW